MPSTWTELLLALPMQTLFTVRYFSRLIRVGYLFLEKFGPDTISKADLIAPTDHEKPVMDLHVS